VAGVVRLPHAQRSWPTLARSEDADEHPFCRTCAFADLAIAAGIDRDGLRALGMLIAHSEILPRGTALFRIGEPFRALRVVRTGSVKTYVIDEHGREQVLGIFLPGELIGLDAISSGRHPSHGETLEESALCVFSFPEAAALFARLPALAERLLARMSEAIVRASMYGGDFSAQERLAAFLLDLERRLHPHRPGELSLGMSRRDIASHLRLAPETLSRVLRRFREEGLVEVRRRLVRLRDRRRLIQLAAPVLRV
jgi:CRP/FNR family transcriptional regulator